MSLLTVMQVAEMLALRVSTVRAWVWRNKIPYVKLERAVRIRKDVAEGLVERGTVTPVSVRDTREPEGGNTVESTNPNGAR